MTIELRDSRDQTRRTFTGSRYTQGDGALYIDGERVAYRDRGWGPLLVYIASTGIHGPRGALDAFVVGSVLIDGEVAATFSA